MTFHSRKFIIKANEVVANPINKLQSVELRFTWSRVDYAERKEVVFLLELVGTYEHNIDGKNRLFVPAKFRAILGTEFIYKVRRTKFPSIQLYSKAQFFKEVEEALAGAKDDYTKRKIRDAKFFGTGDASCDAQGRIVIGASLGRAAKLDKACVLTGYGDFVEIMSADIYDAYGESLTMASEMEEASYEKENELRCQRRAEGAYLDTEV